MRILYIEASPRGDRSSSTRAAAEFLGRVEELTPGVEVDHLDLWSEVLPAFNGPALDAKYAALAGDSLSGDQQTCWDEIARLVARVDRAHAVLLSTPMWNLGVPYPLKHFIDVITQPGLTFRFDPATGYMPLLRPRPFVAILSSAGDFSTGESFGRPDLASQYLRVAFGFIGFADIAIIPVSPTAGPTEKIVAGKEYARSRLASAAADFAAMGV